MPSRAPVPAARASANRPATIAVRMRLFRQAERKRSECDEQDMLDLHVVLCPFYDALFVRLPPVHHMIVLRALRRALRLAKQKPPHYRGGFTVGGGARVSSKH